MESLAFVLLLLVTSLRGSDAIFKTHISNGVTDDENPVPFNLHTVKIFSRESTSTLKGYSCSGSIIDYYWIITAGHCVDGFSIFDVFIGNVTNDLDHVVRASKFFVHPHFFDSDEIVNDIALIKLRRSLATLNNTFRVIPLPSKNDITQNFNGYKGIVSGYGKLGDHGPTSNFANFAYYEIISLEACQNLFLRNYTEYAQNIICAKGIDASSCEGDSGQGLVIYRKGKRKLIGVASKGLESCETIEPEVFTRVDFFLDWIENVIRNN